MDVAPTAKVSVCLPVFNGERFLGAAIESVLNQTHTNLELLICDDGSEDQSWEIIQQYARRDGRVIAWRAPQRAGIFGNYNRCIERARGKYIKFFAQDDLLALQCLAKCVAVMDSHPEVDVLATRRHWIDGADNDVSATAKTPSSSDAFPSDTRVDGKDVLRKCLLPPVNYVGEPATTLIRRDRAGTGFDTSFYHMGDLDYWASILLNGDYYFIDEVLCSFRVHNQSQTTRNTRGVWFAPDFLRLIRKYQVEMERLGIAPQTFIDESLRALATHVEFLFATSEITETDLGYADLRNEYEQLASRCSATDATALNKLMSDLQAFRELSVLALRNSRSGQTISSSAEPKWSLNLKIVSSLERTLRSLLSSDSWRKTRFLRELSPINQLPVVSSAAKLEPQDELSNSEAYILHLRKQIRRVKNSRSWKISAPLRAVGLLDRARDWGDENALARHRSTLFDAQFYLLTNPDIASAYRDDPFTHYLCHGASEGRHPHPLFDVNHYLRQVGSSAGSISNPIDHYLQEGAYAGFDPHILFDSEYYLSQNPDVGKTLFNPLVHYLQYGAAEELNPHPLFDTAFYVKQMRARGITGINPLVHYVTEGHRQGLEPCPTFDVSGYLARNADVRNEGSNPLWHYLTYGLAEGRVGRRFRRISDALNAEQPVQRNVSTTKRKRVQTASATILGSVKDSSISHVLVTGVLTRGGAERSMCTYARAIAEKVGADKVLVVITDRAGVTCGDWLPPGIRTINLLETDPTLAVEDRCILLMNLLSACNPTAVMGFNSLTFWNMVDGYAPLWRNELSCRFVGYLGSYEAFVRLNDWGFNDGPMRRTAHLFDLFVSENKRVREAMIKQYNHIENIERKVVACYKSLMPELHGALASAQSSPQTAADSAREVDSSRPAPKVLWAARLDRIKRPDLLAHIAELMPDVQFEVYGCASPGTDVTRLRVQPNVVLRGEYNDFADIPIHDKVLFLHTSEADGMPHTLLEAAACELPIVAANVGGIPEFVSESTGWLVTEYEDAAQYVRTIRFLLDHPDEAAQRAAAARKLVASRHKWSEFCKRIDGLDIWHSPKHDHRRTPTQRSLWKLAKVSFFS